MRRREARSTQRPARPLGRHRSVGQHATAVDEDVCDARRVVLRILERGDVANRRGVEDRDVGLQSRAQHAAVIQVHARRRLRRHLADGFLERQQMLVAHVVTQNPRKRSPCARVRFRFGQADRPPPARPNRSRRQPADARSAVRTSSSFMIDVMTDVESRSAMTRSMTASRGSFPIALPMAVSVMPSYFRKSGLRTVEIMTPSPPPAAVPLVLPRDGRRIVHVVLDSIALGRVVEPREHLVEPAFADPQRQARRQAIRRTRVGILIGRHVEAARPRGLEAPQHVGHASEVGTVRRLQMPDLGWNRGALGNLEDLVDRLEDTGALGTLMREVHAAVARGHLREFDDLVGRREAIRARTAATCSDRARPAPSRRPRAASSIPARPASQVDRPCRLRSVRSPPAPTNVATLIAGRDRVSSRRK